MPEGHYQMEFSIAPTPRLAAGVPFRTPIIVTFSAATITEVDNREDAETFSLSDLSGAWAMISLTTADMQENLAPPRTDLLRGNTADSIHPIDQEQVVDRPTIGYATFRGLVIAEPGQYRLKVNIIDMDSVFYDGSDPSAGVVLPSLYSQIFEVVEGDEHGVCESKVAETITRLRSMGVDC
ncbi:hypothetical protein EDD37DRAFT_498616 [Exophiala viscosa]|uniref:uncharacterized protein n=1 Tax=Exophiala viscosa TaxID=2486360 RepID=UPI0021956E84|nr:hypothetical protein EDD37DRAFT_498616 [Exophiala viscosa]